MTRLMIVGLMTLAGAGLALAQEGGDGTKEKTGQEKEKVTPTAEDDAKTDDAKTGDAKDDSGLHPRVKMVTSMGDIVIELDAAKAPITVINFLQYVEDKFYDGTIYHRVMSDFMVQGGGFTEALKEKQDGLRKPIKLEARNGLKNIRGTISMARLGNPNSATAQFFINVVDNARLDYPRPDGNGYAVFGKVVEGMETVDKIRYTPVGRNPALRAGGPNVPVETVVIKSVRLMSKFDKSKAAEAISKIEAAQRTAQAAKESELKKRMKDYAAKIEAELDKKFTTTDSGLMWLDLKVGEGKSPKPTDTVEVHYTGWLLDGTKFDSSVDKGRPYSTTLNRVIKGWKEGVGSMKVGGKRKLIVPPDLAYGKGGSPPLIGPNAPLTFDVELLSIK